MIKKKKMVLDGERWGMGPAGTATRRVAHSQAPAVGCVRS
jgi:hypothetical protein